MPSTYSNLKIELIATGEQSGTWGTTTNTNLGTAIEEAITGSADVTFVAGSDTTITLTDTNAAQAARNLRLNLVGTSNNAQNLVLGSGCQIEKLYLVNNTLGHTITVKNTTGNGIAVPAGKTMFVFNNGTDVVDAVTYLTSIDTGTINATTVDTTNLEVTNIKAKDGTAAATIANSTGKITVSTELAVDNLNLSGNTISSTDTNGAINLAPNGTGQVVFNAGAVGTPIITTTGDTNTGIFFPAADTIAFTEGGVEAMRIDSSGNVSIGATSGNGLLNVVTASAASVTRTPFFVSDGTQASFSVQLGTELVRLATGTSDALTFETNSVERMRITSGGDVGIGTSSPASQLEVRSSNDVQIKAVKTGTAQFNIGADSVAYAYSDSAMAFRVGGSGNGTERMRIDSSGNVIVNGTSTPYGIFHVNYSASNSAISARNGSAVGTYAVIGDSNALIGGLNTSSQTGTNALLSLDSANGTRFVTNSAERMRITSAGNVGIGTSSPSFPLDVVGFSRTTVQYILDAGASSPNTTTPALFSPASGVLGICNGGSERMRIDSSGNCGIGTSSPGNRLHVQGSGDISRFTNGSVSLYNYSDSNGLGWFTGTGAAGTGVYYNNTSSYQAFHTNGSEKMRIDSSGNVGIGTSTPGTKFNVTGGSIRNVNTNGILEFANGNTAGGAKIAAYNAALTANGYMAFEGYSIEYGRFDSSGNFGIGTNGPGAKLEVFSASDLAVRIHKSGTAQWNIGVDTVPYAATDASSMAFRPGNTERMRLTSDKLLIGKSSGNLAANGCETDIAGFGGITMTGGAGDGPQWQMINLTAAASIPNGFRWLSFRVSSGATEIGKIEKASSTSVVYTTTSDYRLKENVEPLTNALDKVAQMRPVKWKWKNQNDGGEGFIAHELAEICPLAVTGKKDGMEKDGVTPRYQGVDTSFLVATLTAAIQELKAELDSVKAELKTLKGV